MTDELTKPLPSVSSLQELQEEFAPFVESIEQQQAAEQSGPDAVTGAEVVALVPYVSGLPEKRDRLAEFIRRHYHEADFLREKVKILEAKARRYERIAEQMKWGILQAMQLKGLIRVEGLEYAFSRKRNPPSVKIHSESMIPEEYLETKKVPNKQKILEALKEGIQVEGAVLVEGSERVEVK